MATKVRIDDVVVALGGGGGGGAPDNATVTHTATVTRAGGDRRAHTLAVSATFRRPAPGAPFVLTLHHASILLAP